MEIQRKVEKAIAGYLSAALSGLKFVAADEDAEIEPPYGVVAVDDEQSNLADDIAAQFTVDLLWCSHTNDTPIEAHSGVVQSIRNALLQMPKGIYAEQKLILHGADLMGSTRVSQDKARGHALTLSVGASDQE